MGASSRVVRLASGSVTTNPHRQQPCRRCLTSGRGLECRPSPQRKRGRPRLATTTAGSTGELNPDSRLSPSSTSSSPFHDVGGTAVDGPFNAFRHVSGLGNSGQPAPGFTRSGMGDDAIADGDVRPLISMLIEQVREIQHENDRMKGEIRQMQVQGDAIQVLQQEVSLLKEQVESISRFHTSDTQHVWRALLHARSDTPSDGTIGSWSKEVISTEPGREATQGAADIQPAPSLIPHKGVTSHISVPTYADLLHRASSLEREMVNEAAPFLNDYWSFLPNVPSNIRDLAYAGFPLYITTKTDSLSHWQARFIRCVLRTSVKQPTRVLSHSAKVHVRITGIL